MSFLTITASEALSKIGRTLKKGLTAPWQYAIVIVASPSLPQLSATNIDMCAPRRETYEMVEYVFQLPVRTIKICSSMSLLSKICIRSIDEVQEAKTLIDLAVRFVSQRHIAVVCVHSVAPVLQVLLHLFAIGAQQGAACYR